MNHGRSLIVSATEVGGIGLVYADIGWWRGGGGLANADQGDLMRYLFRNHVKLKEKNHMIL